MGRFGRVLDFDVIAQSAADYVIFLLLRSRAKVPEIVNPLLNGDKTGTVCGERCLSRNSAYSFSASLDRH